MPVVMTHCDTISYLAHIGGARGNVGVYVMYTDSKTILFPWFYPTK